ncbi:MAG: hypothetical protein J6K41_08150 [Paraprevotella sp.]|nr:hypothetical protein [Paraprevotella sp.]
MKKVVLLTALVMSTSATFAQSTHRISEKAVSGLSKVERKWDMFSPLSNSMVKNDQATKKLANIIKPKAEDETKDLHYLNPECTFFADGYAYMYMPAYADILWKNVSEGYADNSYTWLFNDLEGNASESSVVDLTTSAMAHIGEVPALTSGEDSYQYVFNPESGVAPYNIMYGWNPKMYKGLEDIDLTFFDAWDETLTATWTDTYCAGTATNLDGDKTFDEAASADWIDYLNRRYGLTMTKVQNVGYGINFPQPASPYVLKTITFNMFLQCEAGAELKLNLYKINSENRLELLNTLSTTVDEACDLTSANLQFNIESEDEDGWMRDYMVVSEPLVAELTGFVDNDKISAIIPRIVFQGTDVYPYAGSYACTHIVTEGDQNLNSFLDMPQWTYTFTDKNTGAQSTKVGTNWLSFFDAYYPFLALFDATGENLIMDEVVKVNASVEGESVMYLTSSYDELPEDWLITDENGNDVASWVTVKAETKTISDGTDEFESNFITIDVAKADAETSRTATIKVDAGGEGVAVRTFVVSQGENSGNAINTVEAAANNAGVAAIYTIEGKKVSSVDNLNKGVYIVKKTDGSSVKVVKK